MRRIRVFLYSSIAILFFSVGATAAFSQAQTTGDIVGVVKDSSGGTVASAKVSIKSLSRGVTQDTDTQADGIYRFPLLEPGDYEVSVTASGFQASTTKVTVHIGQVSTVNVQLGVQGTTQTVVVNAEAPLLQTENGNASANLTEKQVQEVPNGGNDVYDILWYAPGAVVPRGGSFPSVYGLSTASNMVTLNGMPDLDPFNNATNGGASNLLLGLNEVQEATVVTSGYTGEYGTLAGSNTNVVTKSGTNSFHGDLKYYWSGRAVDANSFFNNASGTPRPFQNANQWAGDIGGPILKNKLFVYFNTEGIRIILPPGSSPINLPTQAFENATLANLSANGLSASLPFYQAMFNFWNNAPGASRAADVLNPGKSGNTVTGDGCGTFTANATFTGAGALPCAVVFRSNVPNFNPETIYSFRIDYDHSTKDRAFFHFFTDHGVQATATDPIDPTDFNEISVQPSWNAELVEAHTFNPSLVNQLTLGVEWYNVQFAPANLPAALAKMPFALSFSDGSFASLAPTVSGVPQGRGVTSAEFADDISWERGSHSFKFGALYNRYDMTDFFSVTRSMSSANLTAFYNGGFDPACAGKNSCLNATTYTQNFPLNSEQPFAMYRAGGYVQDAWKLKPNLTITLAFRVDHASNPICRTVCMTNLASPYLAGGDTVNTPYNQAILTGLFQGFRGLQTMEYQPRVGFAWQVRGGAHPTVIRGGAGLFGDNYAFSLAVAFASNAPNSPSFSVAAPTFGYISPAQSTGSGASQVNPLTTTVNTLFTTFKSGYISGDSFTQLKAALPSFTAPNFTTADPNLRLPQIQKWSLEVQQGLWRNATIDLAYNGDHGIHELLSIGGYNAFGLPGFPVAPLNPMFKTITYLQAGGTSNFNGATASFQDRFGGGTLQVNYEWSHAFDIGFGNGQSRTVEDPYQLSRSVSAADIDVRHYLNANYVWDIPISKWLHTSRFRRVIDGWQVSGNVFARTGFPLAITDSSINSTLTADNYGGATPFANWNGAAVPSCTTPVAKPGCWGAPGATPTSGALFDKISAATGFGNAPRNFIYGPGFIDTDFGLTKSIAIWERWTLRIGAQAFNVLNHPNFSVPQTNVNSSTFGQITAATGPGNSVYGSGLGADSSPRILQIKAQVTF
ncbi:MAG TPA: carboxypeptidase regulatory-like domain-containing protein [Candidatus Acidoferrales bacterium]|nr:carboxypeptidase regulatory-like domain-containing protein [Candidatus Acidoferrales bacterium]